MNPTLAPVMVVAGGALLAAAVLGYALGWLGATMAIALGAVGIAIDTAGALLFVAARRGDRTRR